MAFHTIRSSKYANCSGAFETVLILAAGEPIKLKIAVHEQNLDQLEEMVLQISDPEHPSYGNHLQHHEVRDLTKPTEAASNAVHGWLQDWNITKVIDQSDLVSFYTTVGNANQMLDTEFGWWSGEGKEVLRTLHYSIPDALEEHVDFVQPTTHFGSIKPYGNAIHTVGSHEGLAAFQKWARETNWDATVAPPLAVCKQAITPQCLLELYNVHYGASATKGGKLGYASFLNESARYSDLTTFENTQAMYAQGANFTVTLFNGATNDQSSSNDSTEANLDNQYTISVAYPIPVTEFITAGNG